MRYVYRKNGLKYRRGIMQVQKDGGSDAHLLEGGGVTLPYTLILLFLVYGILLFLIYLML